jgi:hypothetical protein
MTNTYQELNKRAKVLEIIDRRRVETGDPALGSGIERVIIDQCLAELEKDISKTVFVRRR